MVKQFTRYTIPGMLLASLLVLIFALSACGGDSGSSASSSGSSASGSSAAAQTVNIKESKASGKDVYTCDPTTITVKKGDSVQFTNQTDENQDFDGGDSQKAGVDFKLGLNQSLAVPFNTAGTFTIKSEKEASFTVTVQ